MYKTSAAEIYRPVILSVYRLMDRIIGKILDSLDRDTTLYIVSDHGFGPHKKVFFVNKWLDKNGFLKVRKTRVFNQRYFHNIAGKADYSTRNIDILSNPIHKCVEWDKSWFVGSDPYEQGIYYVDHSSRPEYEKRVEHLRQKLCELRDSETGTHLFDRVFHRTELYEGDYIEQAPDIILKMKDNGYTITRGYPLKNKFIHRVQKPSGSHRPDGIFAAYGKDIVAGKKITASILDVAPTILYEMGLPVYEEMDGNVRTDIFSPAFQNNQQITYIDSSNFPGKKDSDEPKYSAREMEEIAGRLRDLGYLD
jgi:predicted AlkP superfamily phosphohydrolase/phosphomutase